jgi:hypothetical protein
MQVTHRWIYSEAQYFRPLCIPSVKGECAQKGGACTRQEPEIEMRIGRADLHGVSSLIAGNAQAGNSSPTREMSSSALRGYNGFIY